MKISKLYIKILQKNVLVIDGHKTNKKMRGDRDQLIIMHEKGLRN
jgi:hypothetical protein